tara:strand:- start:2228 stop:2755 length:528 start_codon:yes stop_codon:yes gene_type:complete
MDNLPQWLIDGLSRDSDLRCPHCAAGFKENGINAIGVRISVQDDKKEVLFIEYHCQKCKKVTMLEMGEMGLEEFCTTVLEDLEKQALEEIEQDMETLEQKPSKGPKAKKKKPKPDDAQEKQKVLSKITLTELRQSRRKLQEFDSHDDFLKHIGVKPASVSRPRLNDDESDNDKDK